MVHVAGPSVRDSDGSDSQFDYESEGEANYEFCQKIRPMISLQLQLQLSRILSNIAEMVNSQLITQIAYP